MTNQLPVKKVAGSRKQVLLGEHRFPLRQGKWKERSVEGESILEVSQAQWRGDRWAGKGLVRCTDGGHEDLVRLAKRAWVSSSSCGCSPVEAPRVHFCNCQ